MQRTNSSASLVEQVRNELLSLILVVVTLCLPLLGFLVTMIFSATGTAVVDQAGNAQPTLAIMAALFAPPFLTIAILLYRHARIRHLFRVGQEVTGHLRGGREYWPDSVGELRYQFTWQGEPIEKSIWVVDTARSGQIRSGGRTLRVLVDPGAPQRACLPWLYEQRRA